MKENFKSGFTAIIGRPNVGKSTLLSRVTNAEPKIASHQKNRRLPVTVSRRSIPAKMVRLFSWIHRASIKPRINLANIWYR